MIAVRRVVLHRLRDSLQQDRGVDPILVRIETHVGDGFAPDRLLRVRLYRPPAAIRGIAA